MAMKATPKKPISIIDAVNDPNIFGPWFKDRKTWAAWIVFLKAMFAIGLDESELAVFQEFTGRASPSSEGYLSATLVIGRRGGKSLILALISAYLSCFFDWSPYLTGGEKGTIVIIATDKKAGRAILRYLKAMLQIPLLAGRITRETADSIELSNDIVIEIQAANYKTVRGYTLVAALCDELAFWRTEEGTANPDSEIIGAIEPAMATIPRAMLLKASSPYAKRGVLWDDYRQYYGEDNAETLVWKASTRSMNPSVSATYIAKKYEADAAHAAAEYGAEFRSDIEAFISREAVEACVVPGRFEIPPMPNITYSAFADPSGGSADSMTMAIVHREGENVIVDAVREAKPPFSPEAVVSDFSKLLASYRIRMVVGDRYAGMWPRERFENFGITYQASAKPKSDLYRDLLPIVNGGRVELLDHPKGINQLCALERRTARGGKDSIDHPPNQHDDVINAIAGAVTGNIATPPMSFTPPVVVYSPRGGTQSTQAPHIRSGPEYRSGDDILFFPTKPRT